MSISSRLLYGTSLNSNNIPNDCTNPKVNLKGKHRDKNAVLQLNDEVLSKHTMLIGGTGCGKTTLFYHFINQIKRKLTSEDVMIIFDSKGDFYSKFFTQNDCLIGNSKQYINKSEHWNIFKEILADGWDETSFMMNTQEICRSFFMERVKSTTNAFFPNAARDLLAAIIISMIREGRDNPDERSVYFFNDVLKQYLDHSDAELIIDTIDEWQDLHSVCSYIEGADTQSQGVLSELYSVMRDILIGVFAQNGKFSMRDFVRAKGGRTLFIEYDLSIGNTLTPIYRLLIDLALKEALGRQSNKGNVYLICDEFKLLPHLEHIDDGVNFGRSLGVKIFAGIQSIEQLYEVYGQSRGRNIAAGFSSVYAFKANDTATREFITGLFGKNIVLERYQTFQNQIVEEKRDGLTVEDWDMQYLKVGEAIVGLPFHPPFEFYFDNYC